MKEVLIFVMFFAFSIPNQDIWTPTQSLSVDQKSLVYDTNDKIERIMNSIEGNRIHEFYDIINKGAFSKISFVVYDPPISRGHYKENNDLKSIFDKAKIISEKTVFLDITFAAGHKFEKTKIQIFDNGFSRAIFSTYHGFDYYFFPTIEIQENSNYIIVSPDSFVSEYIISVGRLDKTKKSFEPPKSSVEEDPAYLNA